MAAWLDALRAVAEPTRVRLLAICAAGEWTVSELTQVIGQSQPRVSRHLKVLADAGLLERFREGAWVFYRLAPGALGRALVELLPPAAELAADRRRLDAVRLERQRRAQAYFDGQAAAWEQVRALTVGDAEVDAAIRALLREEPPSSLIDIGTGTGHMLRLAAPVVEFGLGIDLSLDMLSVARANLDLAGVSHCQLRHGDMYQLPVADRAFDCAILHQVLHFAAEPAAAIREAARVLAPGGRLIVVDLAPHGVERLREEFAHRRLGFADDEIEAWVRAAGLVPGQARRLAGKVATIVLWQARAAGAVGQTRAEAALTARSAAA
ncbi:MAG: methyltransferase domain-containing protein [Geminicoccaceae bacterium]|nr:MAG: methyltransferase domain-containing protein [Geminicoccaceae bacterium]